MQKFGFGSPLGLGSSKPQRIKTNILDLNYDCYVEIFSYLNALEDKLNLARALTQFRDVLVREAPRRYTKINMRMLECISDWDYLLRICGDSVVECELRHGRWDAEITLPFLNLLNAYCKNLRHLHLIFVHSGMMAPSEKSELPILQVLQLKKLNTLSLTDAKAADVLQLKAFTELKALHIDGFDVQLTNDDFVKVIHTLPALERLSLRFSTRRPFPALSDICPALKHLSLENFDGALEDIGEFPSLKSLCLIWRLSTPLNNNLFRTLTHRYAERLEHLQLTKVNPQQVHQIVAIKTLKMLVCPFWPREGLLYLTKLDQLVCLDLQCTEVSLMQLLDVIRNCSELKHLKLGKRWERTTLQDFVYAVQDELCRKATAGFQRKLLLTLQFKESPEEVQDKLREQTNSGWLQLDWLGSSCQLCAPDHHSNHEVFSDLAILPTYFAMRLLYNKRQS